MAADNLSRWQADPIAFIETVLINPGPVGNVGQPFVLLEAERTFLKHAFQTDADGRLLYPELVYGAPKKSGKTGFAAIYMLTMVLLFGERFAEGYCLANDEEQASSRVFQAIVRIVEASPLLMREARITVDKIVFSAFHNATISTVASNYGSAAGANPTISCFDELWAYTSERARRLFDEMVVPPTRKIACRLTVTHAGFEGESTLLLDLYKRGLELPQVGPDLYAGDGLLMFWTHQLIAPWQDAYWLANMRKTRPNQYLRQVENRFVSGESGFVDMAAWDRCVQPWCVPILMDKKLVVDVGIDASVKHDSSAIVAVTWDPAAQWVRLVTHRIFQPTPDQPLDFESTIEAATRDLQRRFQVRKVLFDPYQMASTAQRLIRAGLRLEEFPQSLPNLTRASQNLFNLIGGGHLVVYRDEEMRLAVSRAVAVETARGWRVGKEKQAHRIDVVVALGMAALAAIEGASVPEDPPWVMPAIIVNGVDIAAAPAVKRNKPVHTDGPEGFSNKQEPWRPYVTESGIRTPMSFRAKSWDPPAGW